MTLNPHALGLYFGRRQLDETQTEPLGTAWAFLNTVEGDVIGQRPAPTRKNKAAIEPIHKRALNAHEQMLLDATAFVFLHDPLVGQRATQVLFASEYGFRDGISIATSAREIVSAIQIANLLHDEPSFSAQADAWYVAIAKRYEQLATHPSLKGADFTWMNTLAIVIGAVYDNETLIHEAIEHLKEQINTIHPEGYMKNAVDGDEPLHNFEQTMAVTGGLVLAAEIAEQTDTPLWNYDNRGVSVQTTVAYVVSHYFYPNKWRWGSALTDEQIKPLFIRDGAFLEMAHARKPIHATQLLLTDLRPMFSLHFGGLTTLTHAKIAQDPPKKRAWLW